MSMVQLPVTVGTEVICIATHEDGHFHVGQIYKVNAYRLLGKNMGVRIRDSKRERKDFNFIIGSKNYFWKHFRVSKGAS